MDEETKKVHSLAQSHHWWVAEPRLAPALCPPISAVFPMDVQQVTQEKVVQEHWRSGSLLFFMRTGKSALKHTSLQDYFGAV